MDKQTQYKLDSIKKLSGNLKKELINDLYAKLNMNLFKYKLFEKTDELKEYAVLKKYKYYVTPHIIGINFWLISINHEGKKYLLGFNKKNIKSYQNQIDIDRLDIHIFGIKKSDEKNKNITVFDGKFYICDGYLTYGIFDMYLNNDQSTTQIPLKQKITTIINKLEDINSIVNNNNAVVKMSSIYEFEDIPTLIYKKIKHSNLKINGLVFVPEKTNKIFIYINDSEFNMLRQNIELEDINDFAKSLETPAIPIHLRTETQQDTELESDFILKITRTSDVYEVYKYIQQNDNNIINLYKQILNENRLGIAHIPDIKTSHYCKEQSKKSSMFVLKCRFNKKFNKWQPIIE